MHKPIIKFLLFFSIACSGLVFGAGFALANANTPTTQSEAELIAIYHVKANEIVNQQISDLLNFFNDLNINTPNYTDIILESFSPPEFVTADGIVLSLEEVCLNNLSTACLKEKLSKELLLLYSNLGGNIDRISTDNFSSLNDISTLLEGSGNTNDFVRDQFEVASRLTSQVVEFYAQILQAYPMHVQNQKIIDELKILKNNLFRLRNSIQPFSNIFHNVTSSACE
jgi:hypothetical protein